MKPKYLTTLLLLNKSLLKIGNLKRFISIFLPIKASLNFCKKSFKYLFFKLHLHLFSLFEQILFLVIILLFLFLLSIYFSQIKFLKNHPKFFNFSAINLSHKQFDNPDFSLINKTYIYDFILLPIVFKNHLCHASRKPLKSASNIKIDYG